MPVELEGFKLGAAPAKVDPRTIRLEEVLRAGLPAPPAAVDNSQRVVPWQMLANDVYGDCVVAAYAHLLMLVGAMLGGGWTVAPPEVVQLYFERTGQRDVGLVILDFLTWAFKNYWKGKKILAFAAIDPRNMGLMAQAVSLCGCVFRGIGLPQTAQRQIGGLWEFQPNTPGNGVGSWGWHATIGVGYDQATQLTKDITWGMVQNATYKFWTAYQSEMYAIITEDTPGIDRGRLESALQEIGQYVGPSPEPTPTVTHTIRATSSVSGSISPEGAVKVAEGAIQKFAATPNAGFQNAGFMVDGSVVPGAVTYTFPPVKTDHQIVALFSAGPPPPPPPDPKTQRVLFTGYVLDAGRKQVGFVMPLTLSAGAAQQVQGVLTYMDATKQTFGVGLSKPRGILGRLSVAVRYLLRGRA